MQVPDLRMINLFTGPNAIGKTSIAEAIWLFNGRLMPEIVWAPIVQRWPGAGTLINPLLMLKNRDNGGVDEISISGIEGGKKQKWVSKFTQASTYGPLRMGDGGETRDKEESPIVGYLENSFFENASKVEVHKLTVRQNGDTAGPTKPNVPADRRGAVLITPRMPGTEEMINAFSTAVEGGTKHQLIEMLSVVLPTVQDIEIAMDSMFKPYILATTGSGKRLPITALGDAATRILNITVHFQAKGGGLLIIDEVESGLYYKNLKNVWDKFRALSNEYDTQLFATTHSKECLSAAIEAFKPCPGDLAVHSLRRTAGTDHVAVETFTEETLKAAYELDLDVR